MHVVCYIWHCNVLYCNFLVAVGLLFLFLFFFYTYVKGTLIMMCRDTFPARPAYSLLGYSKEWVEHLTCERGKLLPALYVPHNYLGVECHFRNLIDP